MIIELKGIKYSALDSESSKCFQANVYINGKKEGIVLNDGSGSKNNYEPESLKDILNNYAQEKITIGLNGIVESSIENDETIIKELFDRFLERKMCSNKTLFRIPGKTYGKGQFHQINTKFTNEIKFDLMKEYGENIEILNETLFME